MTQRAIYQDQYVIETQLAGSSDISTLLGTLGDFAIDGSVIGIDVDTLALLLNNHPDINPNPDTIHTRKTTGKSFRRTGTDNEYHMGIFNPNSSWEFDANPTTLALPLWLLFQNGVANEQSAVNFTKRILPYTSSGMEVYASIGRNIGAESQVMDACIVNTISLSSEENQALKASVNFLGSAYRNDVSATLWDTSYTLRAPLLWQNAVVTLRYNTNAGVKLDLTNFSLSFNNNAKVKHYASQNVSKFTLGDLDVIGSMKITRNITNYAANSVIDDWLDTSNNLGVDRVMFIMWNTLQSGGMSTTRAVSGGTAGTKSITVADATSPVSLIVDDIIIIDRGTADEEFAFVSAINTTTPGEHVLTLRDNLAYTHDASETVEEAGRDFFGIRMNIRYDGAPTTGDDELVNEVSFTCVDDETNPSILMGLIDNVDRSIP